MTGGKIGDELSGLTQKEKMKQKGYGGTTYDRGLSKLQV